MYPGCSFQQIGTLYEVLARPPFARRRNIPCPAVERLWEVICMLRYDREESTEETKRRLHRLYSTIQSTPLPPGLAIELHGIRDLVKKLPEELFSVLHEILNELEGMEASPYLPYLNELLENHAGIPVIAGRWVGVRIGEEVSVRFPHLRFIREPRPARILECEIHDVICVLGPVIPEKQWILEVPPAPRVVWMHLGRIRFGGFRQLLFRGQMHLPGGSVLFPPELEGPDIDQDDEGFQGRDHDVSCVLVETENGYRIYIPEEGRIAVITPDGDVSVIQGRDLQPDDMILLREETATDVLHEVADHLLKTKGFRPEHLRELHRRWKDVLMEWIQEFGFEEVSRTLIDKGLPHATPQNIRNWLDEERIGPGDDDEFRRLLEFLEAGTPEEVIRSAHLLRQAHRDAGREISGMIRKALQDERFRPERLKDGDVIQLEDLPGVSLSVYIVARVDRGPFRLPSHQVRRPEKE